MSIIFESLNVQQTLEHGSTYRQIFFNSKYTTTQSEVGWTHRCGYGGPTIVTCRFFTWGWGKVSAPNLCVAEGSTAFVSAVSLSNSSRQQCALLTTHMTFLTGNGHGTQFWPWHVRGGLLDVVGDMSCFPDTRYQGGWHFLPAAANLPSWRKGQEKEQYVSSDRITPTFKHLVTREKQTIICWSHEGRILCSLTQACFTTTHSFIHSFIPPIFTEAYFMPVLKLREEDTEESWV